MENCLMFIFFPFHSEFYDGHEAILFHGMASIYKNIKLVVGCFDINHNLQSNSLHNEAD